MNSSESWIVQRLNKPEKTINPYGNTLEFDDTDSVDRVAKVFSTDYMGAAEYEWGSLPKAMSRMYEKSTSLTMFEINVGRFGFKCWLVYSFPYDFGLFQIMALELRVKRLVEENYLKGKDCKKLGKEVAKNDYGSFYVRVNNLEKYENLMGWFDLQNDFAWFIDKKMAEEFLLLFKNKEDK